MVLAYLNEKNNNVLEINSSFPHLLVTTLLAITCKIKITSWNMAEINVQINDDHNKEIKPTIL